MVDVLIVGAGPAGVSAALTASARGLSTLWFGSRSLSEKLERAELVRNYPGLPDVSGRDMRDAFLRLPPAREPTISREGRSSSQRASTPRGPCLESRSSWGTA